MSRDRAHSFEFIGICRAEDDLRRHIYDYWHFGIGKSTKDIQTHVYFHTFLIEVIVIGSILNCLLASICIWALDKWRIFLTGNPRRDVCIDIWAIWGLENQWIIARRNWSGISDCEGKKTYNSSGGRNVNRFIWWKVEGGRYERRIKYRIKTCALYIFDEMIYFW